MKEIHEFRNKFVNNRSHVCLLGYKGELLLSCNTLFDLDGFLGKNILEDLKLREGLREILDALLPGEAPFELPAVHFAPSGEGKICDMEFHRVNGETGVQIVWVIFDQDKIYRRMEKTGAQLKVEHLDHEIAGQQNKLLKTYLQKLEKANKELDRFAYIVSHDLKTPLRGIRNLSTWIEEDLGDDLPEEVAEHIRMMKRQVRKMDALIEGVLKFSRAGREKMEKESFRVSELIDEILRSFPLPAGIEVKVESEIELLNTYRILLEQVLGNLISNAAMHHDKDQGLIHINCAIEGDMATFEVGDDGPGIDPEFQEKIFEIFQTLGQNDDPESTGIGLAIVKKIVQEVGGKVWVDSSPGKGARFHFTWPLD